MGQSKQNKLRLGSWYGKPIGPGHPDFVPPKKREPVTTETTKEETTHPELVRTLTDVRRSQEGPTPTERRPSERMYSGRPMNRRYPGLAVAMLFASIGAISLGGTATEVEPDCHPKKR